MAPSCVAALALSSPGGYDAYMPRPRNGADSLHQSHPEIVKRLKRAAGHINSIITMVETHRSCAELAQQLHAVERAIANAKRTLIHDHIDNCLDESVSDNHADSRAALKQFKEITKYL